jgi:hypothetical protein
MVVKMGGGYDSRLCPVVGTGFWALRLRSDLVSKVYLILAGIGRGSAQVLYHQQQRSVPGRMQQSPGPNTPQHGYNTQQPIQTVTAGYATQQNTPSFTTQPQQQQQSGGPAPQGYSSQQVCSIYATHWFNIVISLQLQKLCNELCPWGW